MDKPGSQGRANEARAPGPRRLDLRVEAGPPVPGWRVHVPDGSVAAEIKPGDKATAEPAGPSGGGQGRSACGPAARGAASVKPGAFQRTESRFDCRVSLHLRGGSPGVGTSKHWAQAAPFLAAPGARTASPSLPGAMGDSSGAPDSPSGRGRQLCGWRGSEIAGRTSPRPFIHARCRRAPPWVRAPWWPFWSGATTPRFLLKSEWPRQPRRCPAAPRQCQGALLLTGSLPADAALWLQAASPQERPPRPRFHCDPEFIFFFVTGLRFGEKQSASSAVLTTVTAARPFWREGPAPSACLLPAPGPPPGDLPACPSYGTGSRQHRTQPRCAGEERDSRAWDSESPR